jgi:hypothetical protein
MAGDDKERIVYDVGLYTQSGVGTIRTTNDDATVDEG